MFPISDELKTALFWLFIAAAFTWWCFRFLPGL
jgi:hypothetical protein